MSPKLSVCTKSFNEAKCMSFLIKHDELLEKYNKMWDRLSNSIKKRFDSEPIFNEKYIKNKLKSLWKYNQHNFFKMVECQKKLLITFFYQ